MGTENVNANGLSDLREITLDEQTTLLSRDAVGDPLTLKKIDLSRCSQLEEIGDYFFMFADNIEEVVLPEGLRRIGVTAFKGCSKLKKINIPASVERIDAYAFKNCTSLTEVDLGHCSRLEELSVGVFEGAENLRSVVLPEGMKRVCSRAFYKCNELNTVKLPSSVVKVGSQLLYWNYEVDWERGVIAVEGNKPVRTNSEDEDEDEEATEKRTFYQIRITYNNIRFSTAVVADSLEEAWASTDKDWDEEEEYINSWEYKCIEVDEDIDEDEIGGLEDWDEVDWEEYKPYEL